MILLQDVAAYDEVISGFQRTIENDRHVATILSFAPQLYLLLKTVFGKVPTYQYTYQNESLEKHFENLLQM